MKKYYIGIDPGLHGAIALISDQGDYYSVIDMPIMDNGKTRGFIKNCVNAKQLYAELNDWIWQFGNIEGAFIENVGARLGDGSASAFSFGDSFGAVKAVCHCLQIPVNLIAPTVWKKYFDLSSDKEGAMEKAIYLFPECTLMTRKKDHDRAEALLIGLYGIKHLNNFRGKNE